MLAAVGVALRVGLLPGPRDVALTLLPGGLALTVLVAGCLIGVRRGARSASPSRSPRRPVRAFVATLSSLRDGLGEARALVLGGDWKLLGALAYYAFDNAVLWAAFHAYGRTPGLGVLAMGYLVGSLGAALPIPAGIGAVEGGLIGALVLYGAPAASAAAAVLLYRGVSLLIAVPLGSLGWAPEPLAKLRLLPERLRRLARVRTRSGAGHGRSRREALSGRNRRGLLGDERRASARGRTRNSMTAAIVAVVIALAHGGRSQPRDRGERRARPRRRIPERPVTVRRRRVPGALVSPRRTGAACATAVNLPTASWKAL
jgi:hypothetical protein